MLLASITCSLMDFLTLFYASVARQHCAGVLHAFKKSNSTK